MDESIGSSLPSSLTTEDAKNRICVPSEGVNVYNRNTDSFLK